MGGLVAPVVWNVLRQSNGRGAVELSAIVRRALADIFRVPRSTALLTPGVARWSGAYQLVHTSSWQETPTTCHSDAQPPTLPFAFLQLSCMVASNTVHRRATHWMLVSQSSNAAVVDWVNAVATECTSAASMIDDRRMAADAPLSGTAQSTWAWSLECAASQLASVWHGWCTCLPRSHIPHVC